MKLILYLLLAIIGFVAGSSVGPVLHQGTGRIIFLVIVAVGVALLFRSEHRGKGTPLLLVAGIAYVTSLFVVALPGYVTLRISTPSDTVNPKAPLPVEITMKTHFFMGAWGCPMNRAADTGKFVHAPAQERPMGATYDPFMFVHTVDAPPMLQVTDEGGQLLQDINPVGEVACHEPYVIYPGVTIKETVKLKDIYDVSHPGTYRIQAVYGSARSNVITLTVIP